MRARLCSTHAPPTSVAQNRANSNVAEGGAGERLAEPIPFSASFRSVVVAASMLFCFAAIGRSLEPSTPLASYGRQAWGMENGLPQNTVQALVQTKDGFVWLGTEVGLARFCLLYTSLRNADELTSEALRSGTPGTAPLTNAPTS